LSLFRSGKEGSYPDLENFCEKRIKEISPNNHVLRKDCPVKTKKDLQHNEAKELEEDLEVNSFCIVSFPKPW
jgi:hypothetical protein